MNKKWNEKIARKYIVCACTQKKGRRVCNCTIYMYTYISIERSVKIVQLRKRVILKHTFFWRVSRLLCERYLKARERDGKSWKITPTYRKFSRLKERGQKKREGDGDTQIFSTLSFGKIIFFLTFFVFITKKKESKIRLFGKFSGTAALWSEASR